MAGPPLMDVSVADGLLRPVTLFTMNLGPWLILRSGVATHGHEHGHLLTSFVQKVGSGHKEGGRAANSCLPGALYWAEPWRTQTRDSSITPYVFAFVPTPQALYTHGKASRLKSQRRGG